MVDIHAHIIHGVDDGAQTLEQSIAIVEEEIDQGITDIICTPHYRLGMFDTTNIKCLEHFNMLVEEVNKRKLPVNLYFGRELYYNRNIIKTLQKEQYGYKINNTNLILLEFSYIDDPDIEEIIYQFKHKGYKVIIAHIERYQYLKDINLVYQLKKMGALIQINASTIVGKNGLREKSKVLKYIKAGLVDFVASDIHYSRINYMKKAYEIIAKKFGNECAQNLFCNNAQRWILPNEEIAV